ncbi:MAG TPA: hypothetical protein VK530_18930, partial [Candidatus Acidoferrum sp.]|nr:hypothetical protein [Candidatus Acidoferrum sp.]
FQHLKSALQASPKFAPALLNTALIAQQSIGSRAYALQRYQDYLALQPRPANWESVNAAARQLESELSFRPAALTNPATQTSASPTKTNPPVAAPSVNVPLLVATSTLPKIVVATPTNASPSRATPPPQTNIAAIRSVTMPPTNVPPPSVPVTVVSVAPPLPLFVATSSPMVRLNPAPATTNIPPPLVTSPPINVNDTGAEQSKPGLFQRFNPFRNRPERAIATETGRVVVVIPPATDNTAGSLNASRKTFAHYRYANPAPPKPGNRVEAQRAFTQGTKAQRAGNTNEALLDYQLAINADGSYLDAHYNYALLMQQTGDAKRSLVEWETVLAIEPDSINARYNFALALKQADFPHDAAAELEKVLEAKPSEARAHLTLANLTAQQLDDKRRARAHYMKLLELDPRNSQASAIRFWLAANP